MLQIKATFGFETRRFSFSTTCNYTELKQLVCETFLLDETTIAFVDDEGDSCVITNERELEEAIRLSGGCLRITVSSRLLRDRVASRTEDVAPVNPVATGSPPVDPGSPPVDRSSAVPTGSASTPMERCCGGFQSLSRGQQLFLIVGTVIAVIRVTYRFMSSVYNNAFLIWFLIALVLVVKTLLQLIGRRCRAACDATRSSHNETMANYAASRVHRQAEQPVAQDLGQSIAALAAMGFDASSAQVALAAAGGNVQLAFEHLWQAKVRA